MDSMYIPGLDGLAQPRLSSLYEETGTPQAHYAESGPYSCCRCIHKTNMDEPFCIHAKVVSDPKLQDRLVMINNQPAIKICLEHGCCAYVNQARPNDGDNDADDR